MDEPQPILRRGMQIYARVTAERQKGGSECKGPGDNLSHSK